MKIYLKKIYLSLIVFLAVFLLSGCSDYSNENYGVDDDFAIENVELADNEPRTFNGYECTDDCSGHEAGYNWAEEKGITDSSDCGGNSNSFIEGCESYVEEQ